MGKAQKIKTTKYKFPVIIEKDEDGFFVADCPDLPGCHSQGETIDEARKNIEEATRGYLKVAKKFGDKISSDDTQTLETTMYVPNI